MEKELKELLENHLFEDAAEILNKQEAERIAEILQTITQDDDSHLLPLCRELDSDLLAEVLVLLDKTLQEQIGNVRYLSAYTEFVNGNYAKIGYIALPSFISQEEMEAKNNQSLSDLLDNRNIIEKLVKHE